MVKHTVGEEYTNGYSLFDSSATYTFTKDSYVADGDGDAITETLGYSNNTIIMQGVVVSSTSNYAIHSSAAGSTIVVAKIGVLTGAGYGIESFGDDLLIRNFGQIDSSGGRAFDLWGNDPTIINEVGGTIVGRMSISPGSGVSVSTFINHGIVNAGLAYNGSAGTDKIINDGRIVGDIWLNEGDDTLDTRGGAVRGIIEGSFGDDTLITDNAKYIMVEYSTSGSDTVKSTVTYTLSDYIEKLVLLGKKDIDGNGQDWGNTLTGNNGDNTLAGYSGSDFLDGKAGRDTLNGGSQPDTFVFATGYGRDTIEDFVQGEDQIDLSDWKGIKSIGAVKSHASDHGNDLWIVSGKDTLIVANMHKNELMNTDFSF